MNRDDLLTRLSDERLWDVIVIGGGATGLGCAIDAASRGYKTVLLEQHDFGKGTSSRSTKLVHGGVRYLQQGNISLVLEALHERGILRRNAPHLVKNQPFIVPNYEWWEGPFYGIGLKLYDLLAGRHGFGSSRSLSRETTLQHIPTVETKGLSGGVMYYDGQFDDARLIVNMVQTAYEQGATVLNYCRVSELRKSKSLLNGAVVQDIENEKEYELHGRVIINATGVFTDIIRKLDDPDCVEMIKPSQGIHLVLDRSFLPGDSAIMVPHTDDGRVLFAVPWHDKVIVGTTDTPMKDVSLEPLPLQEETDFLLEHAARYLTKDPSAQDVLSVFAGLRPLVAATNSENTAALSRDHTIHISSSGLLTIAGGKWTTYRKMAKDTINQAVNIAQLDFVSSATEHLDIHGHHSKADIFGELEHYGSDATEIQELYRKQPDMAEKLHNRLSITKGQVVWAVRKELARTVEDVLARRTRAILFDAKASIEIAESIAEIMAKELNKSKTWKKDQIAGYRDVASGYLLKSDK